MALSEDQKLAIGEVIGVTVDNLNRQLTWYSSDITPAVELKIADALAEWDKVKNDHIAIMPKESNKGISIDPSLARNEIRRKLARYLYFTDLNFGDGQAVLLRG
jgi:hypothetical protein